MSTAIPASRWVRERGSPYATIAVAAYNSYNLGGNGLPYTTEGYDFIMSVYG